MAHMEQDAPLTDTVETPARRQRPARPVPHGGSKWAALYAGPRLAPAPETAGGFEIHENVELAPDGSISAATGPADPRRVYWLAGGPDISLGRFLSETLPGLPPDAPLVGGKLTQSQARILQVLGRLPNFQRLAAPQNFAAVLTAASAAGGAALAAVTAALRPAEIVPGAPSIVAILPALGGVGRKFALRNRASVAAWLRARRATLAAPDEAPFNVTAELLAAATLVLLADPEQTGLLGLLAPGTRVVEIAPEGWVSSTARSLCAAFGLKYDIFLAGPPSYPLMTALPFGAPAMMSYDVSIAQLHRALTIL